MYNRANRALQVLRPLCLLAGPPRTIFVGGFHISQIFTKLHKSLKMGDDGGWETVPQKPARTKKKAPRVDPDVLPWISHIPPTEETTQFQPFLLLLCGIPGSGKSTFAKSLQHAMPYKFARINQDDLGNRQRCESQAREALANRRCPVIDRCNFDPDQRAHFVALAAEFGAPVDCVVFPVTVEQCIQRCQQRRHHPTVPPKDARRVVLAQARQMRPPSAAQNQEGIRQVKYLENPQVFNDTIVEYLNKTE